MRNVGGSKIEDSGEGERCRFKTDLYVPEESCQRGLESLIGREQGDQPLEESVVFYQKVKVPVLIIEYPFMDESIQFVIEALMPA
jgi:hypothetical protein